MLEHMTLTATTVTIGIIPHPSSLMSVNGSAKRYKLTACFR
jgi:hypothetical protein